eukprot:6194845-Pleurochrysis_carterae.AAC.2
MQDWFSATKSSVNELLASPVEEASTECRTSTVSNMMCTESRSQSLARPCERDTDSQTAFLHVATPA